MLKSEVKLLGKKPVTNFSYSLSSSKIQLADRLGFLLHFNSEQTVQIQFKKEKKVMQCSACGARSHVLSKCSNIKSKESMNLPASNQIYYQKGRGQVVQAKVRSRKSNVHWPLVSSDSDSFCSTGLAHSSTSSHIGRHRECDKSDQNLDRLRSHSECHVLSKPVIEFKAVDKGVCQYLSSRTKSSKSSSFHHSASGIKFKHHHRALSNRSVKKTRKESGIKRQEPTHSTGVGQKHKKNGWIANLRLLKCGRFGHLYSNYSHVLENELL